MLNIGLHVFGVADFTDGTGCSFRLNFWVLMGPQSLKIAVRDDNVSIFVFIFYEDQISGS